MVGSDVENFLLSHGPFFGGHISLIFVFFFVTSLFQNHAKDVISSFQKTASVKSVDLGKKLSEKAGW